MIMYIEFTLNFAYHFELKFFPYGSTFLKKVRII